MSRRPNLTAADKEFIVERREQRGWSYKRIANALGVSPGSVAWHCLQMGAESPKARPIDKTIRTPLVAMRNGKPVRRFTPQEDCLIEHMSLDGKGDTEIARALDRRPNSIRGRLMTLARHQARAEVA